jgi:hypothetical protein
MKPARWRPEGDLSPLATLGFLLGASFASGLNLYATVAALGLLHRYEVIRLPATLDVLAHPLVLGVAVALYVVEFVADKIPYVDNLWDVIHTFIRPPAAGVLAYAALGGVPEAWRLAAALLAGGVALTSHGTKASARAAANTSPEPASNWALSLGEDGIAISLAWLAVTHPVATLVLVLVLLVACLFLVVVLFRFLGKVFRKIFGRGQAGAAVKPPGAAGVKAS